MFNIGGNPSSIFVINLLFFSNLYFTVVTQQWCNVFIMQLSTERHVSTLQGHHQAYKIMILVKVHAIVLPAGSRGLQFNIY